MKLLSTPVRAAKDKQHPVYESDPRVMMDLDLDQALKDAGEAPQAGSITGACSGQSGVILNLQAGWGSRRVFFCPRRIRMDRLMERLARFLGGEWYAVEDRYILAESLRQASMRVITFRESDAYLQSIMDAIHSRFLSPSNWARLDRGQTLTTADLSPGGRSLAHQLAIVAVARSAESDLAEAMENDLRLSMPIPGSPGAEVFIRFEGIYGRRCELHCPLSRPGT